MFHPLREFLLCAVLCAAAATAAAQAVYKCGTAYGETPCVDGKALAARDQRTEAQKSQADDTAIRQKKAAGEFEKDRVAQEKRDAKALKEAGSAVVVGKPERAVGKVGKVTPIKPLKPLQPAKPAKVGKKKKPVEEKPYRKQS